MKNFEGKVPVSHLTYIQLADLGLKACEDRSNFSSLVHAFMVLCWNLFARSCSVADLRTHHFSWENDSMVVDMSRHKADQTGEKITPKHMYANPFNPEICPVIALALHVFAISFRTENDDKSRIFLGSPYDVFTKWLGTALEQVPLLGHSVKDFGTHFFRKGIATFCSGFIGGPSVIAIFLRAGWSLGQVQDRYITYSDGGDQFCGRVAAGLDLNSGSRFAALPARIGDVSALTTAEWNLICPGYNEYPPGFQTCIPFLTAQIAYHHDWICRNIGQRHPIFSCRLFTTGLLEKIKPYLLEPSFTGKCNITGITATGIPPHLELSRRLEIMQLENIQLKASIEEIEHKMMVELPGKLTEELVANFHIDGIQQISKTELRSLMSIEFEKFRDNFTNQTRSYSPDDTIEVTEFNSNTNRLLTLLPSFSGGVKCQFKYIQHSKEIIFTAD